MAEFREDFDLDTFAAAYDSEDPTELNRVKPVERGVGQLYNSLSRSQIREHEPPTAFANPLAVDIRNFGPSMAPRSGRMIGGEDSDSPKLTVCR